METTYDRIFRISLKNVTGKDDEFQIQNTTSDETIMQKWNMIMSLQTFLHHLLTNTEENVYYEKRKEKNRHFLDASDSSCDALASAGMVAEDGSQIVKCISCSIEFRGWSDSDNPFDIHANMEPKCFYMQLMTSMTQTKPTEFSHDKLFYYLKGFVQSSKFEVAKELSYDPHLLVALACRKKMLGNEEYKTAGDLVNDADEASYDLFEQELPNPERTLPKVMVIDGFYEILMKVIARLQPLKQVLNQCNHREGIHVTDLHTESQRAVVPVRAEPRKEQAPLQKDQRREPKAPHIQPQEIQRPSVDLKTETERLYYSSRCKGCLSNPASHVVLPCSELSICTACLKNLKHCPNCQGPIETSIQTFM